MRYLITGGAGFIGSHLADALVARGERVLLFDNLSTGRLDNVQHLIQGSDAETVEFRSGTVLDYPLVERLVREVDVVVHLAASVGVQLIVSRPLESLMNNVRGTEVVLESAAAWGRKILVASTSEIYGKNAAGPLHEESDRILGSPFKARWAYSTSKAVDEIMAYEYWRERGLPTIVVRLFNCSGPRQTGAYGMVLPRFVRQALNGEDLTVFGDGTQTRCFCHVVDTVDARRRLHRHGDAHLPADPDVRGDDQGSGEAGAESGHLHGRHAAAQPRYRKGARPVRGGGAQGATAGRRVALGVDAAQTCACAGADGYGGHGGQVRRSRPRRSGPPGQCLRRRIRGV